MVNIHTIKISDEHVFRNMPMNVETDMSNKVLEIDNKLTYNTGLKLFTIIKRRYHGRNIIVESLNCRTA